MRWAATAALAVIAFGALPALAETDVGAACTAELDLMCNEKTMGSEGAMRCLIEHRGEVSKPCGTAVDARRAEALERVRAACTAEISNYCSDDAASGRAPFHCLRGHEAQLSASCKVSLPRWAG